MIFSHLSGVILQERHLLLLQTALTNLAFYAAFKKALPHLLNARAVLP